MNDRVESLKRHGYFSLENQIVDDYLPTIGDSAFVLYCVLCRIAGQKDTCFPGKEYLMLRAKQSRNTLQKNLAVLRECGLINVIAQYDADGGQGSNIYQLLPLPDEREPSVKSWVRPSPRINPQRKHNKEKKTKLTKQKLPPCRKHWRQPERRCAAAAADELSPKGKINFPPPGSHSSASRMSRIALPFSRITEIGTGNLRGGFVPV
jgi:hypothetical protein